MNRVKHTKMISNAMLVALSLGLGSTASADPQNPMAANGNGSALKSEPASQTIPTFGGSDPGLRIFLQALFGIPICGIGPAVPLAVVTTGLMGMKWSHRRRPRR